MDVPSITYEGIMTELRSKRISFLFDAIGTRPRVYQRITHLIIDYCQLLY